MTWITRGALAVVLAVTGCSGGGADDGDAAAPTDAASPLAGCGDGADVVLVFSGSAGAGDERTTDGYEGGGDVAALTIDGEVRPLTTDGGSYGPSLSPDGTEVVLASIGDAGVSDTTGPDRLDLFVVGVDGSEPRLLLDAEPPPGSDDDPSTLDLAPDWSPDGRMIAFVRAGDWVASLPDSGEPRDRIMVTEVGDGAADPLVEPEEGADDGDPAWSPDGDLLAFVRRDGRSDRLMVTDPDGDDEREVHAAEHIGPPAWSPDGEHLLVSDSAQPHAEMTMTMVDVGSGEATDVEPPVVAPAWAPNGLVYGYSSAPAIADVSGRTRVAEVDLSDDGGRFGRAVPTLGPPGFLYTDYAIDVPPCATPDAPPLTSEADQPTTLTVDDPTTGASTEVLTRDQAEAIELSTHSPGAVDASDIVSLLVHRSDLTPEVLESTELEIPGPTAPPDPSVAGTEPSRPSRDWFWLVDAGGSVTVMDAISGEVLLSGGGVGWHLPDVADRAPT